MVEQHGLWGGAVEVQERVKVGRLRERFIVPPFSVLDARQGYWKERKKAWLSLGIQSELGRGDNIVPNGPIRDANQDGCYQRGYGKGATTPGSHGDRRPGRESGNYSGGHAWMGTRSKGKELVTSFSSQARLTALQKTGSSKVANSDINGIFGPPKDAGGTESQTGTSIFDPVLCELMYTWFCPPGGFVYDPFAGGSVRGIVAAKLGRRYTGIDLSERQMRANEEQRQRIIPDEEIRWIVGDSREAGADTAWPYDFIFSCPPYANLERYSDDPRDLSTMDYPQFLTAYREIVAKSLALLRMDRFACFVVGDVRDKAGHYRNLVSETIAAFRDAGAELYNEAILMTAAGSLPIRVGKQFTSGRKLGKTHQNVLVFVKGDWRKAVEALA